MANAQKQFCSHSCHAGVENESQPAYRGRHLLTTPSCRKMNHITEGSITRIKSMDATIQDFRRWEWDCFLPPNWRFEDAQRLAAGEEPQWSSDDPAIVECAAYLEAVAAAHDEQEQAAVRHRWPWLAAAHEIAQQDGPRRWEVEARLLAGQTDEAIGARCALPPETLSWYEQVFFNVRPRHHARMWVCNQVIGPGIQHGFSDDEVGPLWAAFAYFGGPIVLNALVDAFRVVWRAGEPVTLSSYLQPGMGIDPRLQAVVASSVLPHSGRAGEAWERIRCQLQEADAAEDQDRGAFLRERAREWLIRCARAYLAGKPLPRPRRRPQPATDRDGSATGADGTRTQGMSAEAMLMDFLWHAAGVDAGAVKTLPTDMPVPARQA
jgi:hypothetical protein